MSGRRDRFILAGVVRADLGPAGPTSLDLAMPAIEQTTRDAVRSAGQRVTDVRVVPGELAGTVLVDIRFSGDRAGAIAALERWRTTVPDVAGGGVILRTLLRGADVNLEWSDEEYDRELQTRGQRPDSGSRSARRSWLTDWEEAARHPWKTRLFMVAGGAALGIVIVALTGHLAPVSLAAAAAAGAVIGAAMGEYAMRAARRPTPGAERP